jgi:hypothetical protein
MLGDIQARTYVGSEAQALKGNVRKGDNISFRS